MEKTDPAIERGRQFLKSNWHLTDSFVSDQSKGVPVPPLQKPCPAGSRLIELVKPAAFTPRSVTLWEAILGRKSRRSYTVASLTMEELSFLLFATQGIKQGSGTHSFRTVPSGGARHSLDTYVSISRVDGIPRGLYRYLPVDHALCLVDDAADVEKRLDKAMLGQSWKAAAVFVWAAVPYRMEWRYSVVSHKVIALDAGHVCQNLYLACEAIGCGTCAIGAYDQDRMDTVLRVDGQEEFAVYTAPVGKIKPEARR
jgi:SagB-type dehydrogenase family enzyme